jgi:antitoxin YefM
MNIKTILPISEARKKIFDIAKKVQRPNTYYTLTEKGRPKAVVMSAEEFESLQETIEVTRDFPNLEKEIKEAKRDYKKGDYITLQDFLAKEGYVLEDKKRKHGISGNHTKKGSKAVR